MKKVLLIFLFILFILPISFSNNFAQIEIFVDDTGAVSIEGITNLDELNNIKQSQIFTSKTQEFWILNISTKQELDSFVFNLYMPQYSKVNYIKTTPNLKIEEENDRIKFIGIGENKPLNILVQYKIQKPENIITTNPLIYISLFIIIISILGIFILLFKLIKKYNSPIKIESKPNKINNNENIKIIIPENLPQRQKDIINILKDNKILTQKQLEEKMQIPKSSISRNVRTLEIKGYLIKEKSGQTNYLKLNENI